MGKGEWSRNWVGAVLAATLVGVGGVAVVAYQVHSAQVAGAQQVAQDQRVMDAARAVRVAVESAAQGSGQGVQQPWHQEVASALLGLEYVGANQIEVREQVARVRGLWVEHQSATELLGVLSRQKRTAEVDKLAQTGYQAQVRNEMRTALEEIELSARASVVVQDVQTKAQTREFVSSTAVVAACAFASVGLVGLRLRREQRVHQEVASRSRLRREMAAEAMVTVDAEGRIQDVNRRAEDVFGYHKSELVGESIEVLVPQRVQLPVSGGAQSAQGEKGAPARRLEGVKKDGTAFPVTLDVRSVVSEDHQRLAVCTIRDAQGQSQVESAGDRGSSAVARASVTAGSVRDALTDLFSRNYLEEFLEAELRRAGRKHRRVGAIIVDLDRFRQVNDVHGVAAGDAVLREVGARLRARTRREDVVARYGGEEFAIVLPEASIEATKQCAEQVREDLRDLRVQAQNGTVGPVTVSVGVAVYPDHGVTTEDLLSAAKQALTQAKSGGRDRVVVAQPLSWEPTGAELAMLSKQSGA
ncbi:MAG: GGDEF domain-containing protein [Nitrospirae bacterium]|nr:GGDEF domain-containing protein [Nitrospirota bacterium]